MLVPRYIPQSINAVKKNGESYLKLHLTLKDILVRKGGVISRASVASTWPRAEESNQRKVILEQQIDIIFTIKIIFCFMQKSSFSCNLNAANLSNCNSRISIRKRLDETQESIQEGLSLSSFFTSNQIQRPEYCNISVPIQLKAN